MKMTTCDYCDVRFPQQDRVVAAQPRPSDPTELCAVLWGCGKCEPTQDWPTPAQLEEKLEAGELPGILFLTV